MCIIRRVSFGWDHSRIERKSNKQSNKINWTSKLNTLSFEHAAVPCIDKISLLFIVCNGISLVHYVIHVFNGSFWEQSLPFVVARFVFFSLLGVVAVIIIIVVETQSIRFYFLIRLDIKHAYISCVWDSFWRVWHIAILKSNQNVLCVPESYVPHNFVAFARRYDAIVFDRIS